MRSGLKDEMISDQARAESDCLLLRIVAAVGGIDLGMRLLGLGIGLHIDRCAKGSCAIGRCTCAPLHLDTAQRTGKVGGIDPIVALLLSIVHRDAIGCDIDTAGIDAADAQRGIADAHSGIARRSERGGHIEQEGDVHAYILARDLRPRDIGKSDRRRPGSPGRHDIYTLELYSPQGITTQMARCTGHAASAHQHKG